MKTSSESQAPPLGHRLRAIRRGRRLTQRELSRRTGLAEPFLSRIENGRASPSVETLGRLAAVLDVSVADLLAAEPARFQARCPVSRSGRCIAESIHYPGPRRAPIEEHYTPSQVRLLQLADYVVQCAGAETLAALGTVMHAMTRLPTTRRDPRWLHAITRGESSAMPPGAGEVDGEVRQEEGR